MSADHDQEFNSAPAPFAKSIGRMFRVLLRPELAKWRFRIGLAFVLTVASKGLAVIAPVFMGEGVNRIIDGDAASAGLSFAMFFILFAGARFASNGLPYVRDGFFSPVTQDAQRLLAVDAFRHAQHLDLQFHLTRRSGALNRIIERLLCIDESRWTVGCKRVTVCINPIVEAMDLTRSEVGDFGSIDKLKALRSGARADRSGDVHIRRRRPLSSRR